MLIRRFILMVVMVMALVGFVARAGTDVFAPGRTAYQAGHFVQAGQFFKEQLKRSSSAEAWANYGNAAWQATHPGEAVLAWERALWINPYDTNAAFSLAFAEEGGQVSDLPLTWNEKFSTWLPPNFWVGLAAISLWVAIGLMVLVRIFRRRKLTWPQLVSAAAMGIFLLTLPALAGVHARAKTGVVSNANTPLRQTPTQTAQVMTRLAAGEMIRYESTRGNYYFVRTANDEMGWLATNEVRFVAANDMPDWPSQNQVPAGGKVP